MYNFGLSQYTRNLIYRVLSEVFHNSTINHPILEDNSSFKGKFTLLLGILGMLFLFACFVEPIIILGYYINLGWIFVIVIGFISCCTVLLDYAKFVNLS